MPAAQNSVLRFITCGSVDDGKSTLIGQLLALTQHLPEDLLQALQRDSLKHGTQGTAIDYALALDGLAAEREQGITIDVAYRYFQTPARKFIVADCPGHEQYTRNMATGASTAQLAIVLVDARKGVLLQTLRHSAIVAMFGVRRIILAVNKMDAIDFDVARFAQIEADYRSATTALGVQSIQAIPISALHGLNLTQASTEMPWYLGPPLLQWLEQAPIEAIKSAFCMPVQLVLRPDQDFRGLAGTISGGALQTGDALCVNGDQNRRITVNAITRAGAPQDHAIAGDAVVLCVDERVDISRGDVLSCLSDAPSRSDRFEAQLLWMSETPAREGQRFLLKLANRSVNARLEEISTLIDISVGAFTSTQISQTELLLNSISRCIFRRDFAGPITPFAEHPSLGAFILVDRHSCATLAAGTVTRIHAPREVTRHPALVSAAERALQKGQRPRCYWFTGLSGAGKSTLASALDRRLSDIGQHCTILDGDNIRHGLTRHLSFSESDRKENIRLVAETAKLMLDAGLVVLVSLISPFRADRDAARALFKPGEFLEVFVDTPLAVAESRDPKGLYAKARSGQLKGFTGIDAPYEAPVQPEVHLHTQVAGASVSVDELVGVLLRA
jgi:bifunctional enzyme CysN/CysC